MKSLMLSALGLMLLATTLQGCKGRTTDTVTPDGSQPQEVNLLETESASEARDSLRSRVKDIAPQTSQSETPDSAANHAS